ncbi:MAG: hypothetical protein AAGG75_16880 [Bacteroidota bacterium]
MKNAVMNKVFRNKYFQTYSKLFCCTVLFLALTGVSYGQDNIQSKTIEKTFDRKEVVQIEHRYGPMVVKKATDGKIKVTVTYTVEGNNQEGMERTLNYFDLDISDSGSSLSLKTDLNIQGWSISNKKSRITFKDGKKVKGVKIKEAAMTLFLPQGINDLELANKYEDIELADLGATNTNVKLYSGTLRTFGVLSNLTLNLKYGKAYLKDVKKGRFDIYDSKFTMGNSDDLNIKSKYSEFQVGDIGELEIISYDDDYELGTIKGLLVIEDKYSEIEIKGFQKARMKIYDAKLESGDGQDLQIDSKYTKYRFTSLSSLTFDDSYDDDVAIEKVGDLSITSKYTEFRVGEFNGELDFETYDDKLFIRKVGGGFAGMKVTGKYTDLEVPLSTVSAYTINAQMKYGRLNYPQRAFSSEYYKEKDGQIEMRGTVNGGGDSSPNLQFDLYDCKVDLN